jgi:1-acyl-sn-glycerol-3-phosphate acyltransferase
MTFLRSLIFFVWFLLASVVIQVAGLPALLLPAPAARWVGAVWCRAMLSGLRVFVGMKVEIRGTVPKDAVLIAAKHMSMLDTMVLFVTLDFPLFVLKRELTRIPFFGWFASKAGMIAIDRSGGASALRRMAQAVKVVHARGHSVIIFPEGTRKKPGAPPDYKPGVAGLYGQLDVPCVPVALNSGLFWQGFTKRGGTMIAEFLPAIPPGLKRRAFMDELENRIETATRALVAEGRAEQTR